MDPTHDPNAHHDHNVYLTTGEHVDHVAETIDHVIPGMMHNHELVTAQVPVMETLPDGTQHEVVQTYHTNQHQHHELVADLARRSCWWSASATYGNVEHRRKPCYRTEGQVGMQMHDAELDHESTTTNVLLWPFAFCHPKSDGRLRQKMLRHECV